MVRVFAVVDKIDLTRYKKITGNTEKEEYPTQVIKETCDDVLLFFSFDIVNSSLYKTVNYYGWSIVIDHILSQIRSYVKTRVNRAEVWRIFGDEIIFIVEICDRDFIFEYTNAIYEILCYYCEIIESGEIFEHIEGFSEVVTDLMKLQDVISLQACAWIAVVTDKKEIKNNRRRQYVENVFEIIEEGSNNKFYEFMGIDIDTGFRLAKETREKRFIVSFELAYILAKEKEYVKRLNIVTYKVLKGVWGNSVYPIIWYYDSTKHNNISFKRSMPFDAIDRDELYVEYFGKKKFADYMYTDTKNALKKICKDRKLQAKISNMEQLIEQGITSYKQFINDSKLELHCVAVCYNKEGEILLVQRCNKDFLPGKWEFGCVKANAVSDLAQTIENEYKEDFNIEIKLHMDSTREDAQPVPLAVYKIEKNNELHKGIIFIAKIIGGDLQLNDKKHQIYKFIREEDINSLKANECVLDAIDTLKKAFIKIKEIQNG